MANAGLNNALEAIYDSLKNDNEELDARIATLKQAMKEAGKNAVEVDPTKLAQPNRQGRKLMQSYFRKRGVVVNFCES